MEEHHSTYSRNWISENSVCSAITFNKGRILVLVQWELLLEFKDILSNRFPFGGSNKKNAVNHRHSLHGRPSDIIPTTPLAPIT